MTSEPVTNERDEADDKGKRAVKFHFIKSTYFRVIHTDGFFGGVTPQGGFHIGVYSERSPFPDLVINEIDENGLMQGELSRVGREGVVRELEADLAMDIPTALSLLQWLQSNLKALRQVQGMPDSPDIESESDGQ
jgi:hypothetical protein